MGCFLFDDEFWGRLLQELYVFSAKNGFCNAKFSEFGGYWGGGDHFLTKPPKGTSLPDFTRFKQLCVQIRSRVFSLAIRRKKGHYKKSRRGYNSPICGEFPTQPNLTKIGIWVGVADIISHTKFGNDRSREYTVTEGRILACSIGMACRI